jgi:hypothetical protein
VNIVITKKKICRKTYKINTMRKIYVTLVFVCFSMIVFSQSASNDSTLRPNIPSYTYQQNDIVNIYYDALNAKFVIENNTRQIHNFFIGVYNLTGTPVLEIKKECMIGKEIDIPVDIKAGLYIVNVVDKPFVFTKKFIIQ